MIQNLENEIWRPVLGFEDKYEVSNMGRVKSLSYLRTGKSKILVSRKTVNGYLKVSLWSKNKEHQFAIHRLVYEAFIGKLPKWSPKMKGDVRMEVNHINEIKTDNRLDNLELVTCTENNNYGKHKSRVAESNSRKVYQYTLEGKLVKVWPSVLSTKDGGFVHCVVGLCCRNKYNHPYPNIYKGYIWRYSPIESEVHNG